MNEGNVDDLVRYRVEDQIAIISLNRPGKLNAFSDELVFALGEALNRFDTDDEANVAIIHGNGRALFLRRRRPSAPTSVSRRVPETRRPARTRLELWRSIHQISELETNQSLHRTAMSWDWRSALFWKAT